MTHMTHPFLTITVARNRNQERLAAAAHDRLLAEATRTPPRGLRATVLGAMQADLAATIGAVALAGSVLVSRLV